MNAAFRSVAVVLALLGRQGSRALAVSVVLGLALPPVGAVLKPYVTQAVFVLLCLAFLRMDPAAALAHLRRPALTLVAIGWTSLAVPLVFGLCARELEVDARSPQLFHVLVLQGVASPMMAAPALAALMGLDATLVLLTLIGSSALVPFSAPLIAHYFLGDDFMLSPLVLGGRLFLLLAGSAVLALILRRLLGVGGVVARAAEIDGLNIIALYVFVAAVMGEVGAQFISRPMLVLGLAALGFAVFLAVFAVTVLLFAPAGRRQALALGFMACHRNMGLMVAGAGGTLPEVAWLYFAVSQFPIYLSPYLFAPVVRRLAASGEARARR